MPRLAPVTSAVRPPRPMRRFRRSAGRARRPPVSCDVGRGRLPTYASRGAWCGARGRCRTRGCTCLPNVSTASIAISTGIVVESMPNTSWSAPDVGVGLHGFAHLVGRAHAHQARARCARSRSGGRGLGDEVGPHRQARAASGTCRGSGTRGCSGSRSSCRDARSRARCAVLEAQHLARDHDVVVHVLADRLGVVDLLLVRSRSAAPACSGEPVVKHSTPRPMRAAFSNVPGLPAATHIGGCGSCSGFGSTLRGGIEKNSPSKRVLVSRHMRLNCGSDLVEHLAWSARGRRCRSRVCSVVDEPRPMPNSNRPPREVVEHRDALGDAGRVVHRRRDVEDARAEVDALGARRDVGRGTHSFADRCEYSVRKWCSVAHVYLNPARSAASVHVDLVDAAGCARRAGVARRSGWCGT